MIQEQKKQKHNHKLNTPGTKGKFKFIRFLRTHNSPCYY